MDNMEHVILFHYLIHRLVHNKQIYKYIHKKHHTHHKPQIITTYFQSPIDILLTNVLPAILTIYILGFSYYHLCLWLSYKLFIEIIGHSGKKSRASSFVQFMWLPKWLNIELHNKDHDVHHSHFNCNYSKRFKLWDIIFGSYKEISDEKNEQ